MWRASARPLSTGTRGRRSPQPSPRARPQSLLVHTAFRAIYFALCLELVFTLSWKALTLRDRLAASTEEQPPRPPLPRQARWSSQPAAWGRRRRSGRPERHRLGDSSNGSLPWHGHEAISNRGLIREGGVGKRQSAAPSRAAGATAGNKSQNHQRTRQKLCAWVCARVRACAPVCAVCVLGTGGRWSPGAGASLTIGGCV